MSDTELAHYGVKGMKWGVRKAADTGSADVGGGGGGGAVELDEETQELLKAISEGKVDPSALSAEQRAKISNFLSRSNENTKSALGDAAKAVGDYVQHLPSDGIFQFTRKDKTGWGDSKEDRDAYLLRERSSKAMEERNQKRKAAVAEAEETRRANGGEWVEKTTKRDGFGGIFGQKMQGETVYRRTKNGEKYQVAGTYTKENGDVVYEGPGSQADIRSRISRAKASEKAIKENTARKYARGMGHDAFSDPVYLVHHGVKGMKWGVRRSKSERYADKSARYAGKSAKHAKKAAKYAKKELRAKTHGRWRKGAKMEVKKLKREVKANKFSAKSQKMLKKSMQLKANEVDQQTKDAGRKQIDKIVNS